MSSPATTAFPHAVAISRRAGSPIAVFGTVPLGARRLTRIGDLRAARQLDLGLGQGASVAPCPVLALETVNSAQR